MGQIHKEIPVGTRFGMLDVVASAGSFGGRWKYSVKCDCGGSAIVYASHLLSGATRSCKCKMGPLKHGGMLGGKATSEYRTWYNMKNRCLRTDDPGYPNYGGRGIGIHPRWMDFANFLADMGKKPSARHSIERINNNGNYEPGNCRWATPAEQMRNTRRTIKVDGLCLKDACAKNGIEYGMAHRRVYFGEDPASAVSRPPKKPKHMVCGVPLAEAARKAGLDYKLVLWRKQHGWSDELILRTQKWKHHANRKEKNHANLV